MLEMVVDEDEYVGRGRFINIVMTGRVYDRGPASGDD
jgi:hypothetical protein